MNAPQFISLTCPLAHQRSPESVMHAGPWSVTNIVVTPYPRSRENHAHNDVIATRLLYHVGNKFRCNRRPTLVFFVLSGIRKQWQYRSDPSCACYLAGMYHNAEFH